MRVLVRTKPVGENPDGPHVVEVVDAETGEQIEGVTSLWFSANAKGNHLALVLADYDIDIDHDAQVLSEKDLESSVKMGSGCEGIDYA